jgi:hypothetical protein
MHMFFKDIGGGGFILASFVYMYIKNPAYKCFYSFLQLTKFKAVETRVLHIKLS